MRRIVLVGIVVIMSASRRAEACHDGYQIGQGSLKLAILLVDAPLVIHNVVVKRSSRGFGVAEIVLTAPQVAGAIALIRLGRRDCYEGGTIVEQAGGHDSMLTLSIALNVALFVHGVYVVATPREPMSSGTPQTRRLVTPTVLSTERGNVPGLALVGTF